MEKEIFYLTELSSKMRIAVVKRNIAYIKEDVNRGGRLISFTKDSAIVVMETMTEIVDAWKGIVESNPTNDFVK